MEGWGEGERKTCKSANRVNSWQSLFREFVNLAIRKLVVFGADLIRQESGKLLRSL